MYQFKIFNSLPDLTEEYRRSTEDFTNTKVNSYFLWKVQLTTDVLTNDKSTGERRDKRQIVVFTEAYRDRLQFRQTSPQTML